MIIGEDLKLNKKNFRMFIRYTNYSSLNQLALRYKISCCFQYNIKVYKVQSPNEYFVKKKRSWNPSQE